MTWTRFSARTGPSAGRAAGRGTPPGKARQAAEHRPFGYKAQVVDNDDGIIMLSEHDEKTAAAVAAD